MSTECPFCTLPRERILIERDAGWVIRDACPISKGHTLVIPRRHAVSLFELEATERHGLIDLIAEAREQLVAEFKPDGLNVGINDGPAAGQTVMHVHVHLIPRYRGDMPDPRGGIRHMFPSRAKHQER